MRKVYVAVNADFNVDGKILPRSFTWEDDRQYEVDRVLDVRPAASLRVGGIGQRYTVVICGKQTYMWLEDGNSRWFMEGK